MKKIITFLLVVTFALYLTACDKNNNADNNQTPNTEVSEQSESAETVKSNNKKIIEIGESVSLYESDTVKIDLVNFYQETVTKYDGTEQLAFGFNLNVHNKSNYKMYIEDGASTINGEDVSMLLNNVKDSAIFPGPCESQSVEILIQNGDTYIETPEELYTFKGNFFIHTDENSDNVYESGYLAEFSFADSLKSINIE